MDAMTCQLLLVEDDAELRAAMAELLEERGFQVLEAANGSEALVAARAGGAALILLDMMMPVMDGWTFLRHRASDPVIAAIPVVVLTAQRHHDVPIDDVVAVLPKPPDMVALLALIESICNIDVTQR